MRKNGKSRIGKRISAVLMMMLGFAMCTACGREEKDERRVIRVGMEIGYPPFEYYDEDGATPIGIDVELAKAIGEELGVDIELVNTSWDSIFDGLNNGDYDCIISAVTITPQRTQDFDFTEPYIQNYQCIVALKDADIKPTDLSQCEGIRLGFQEETIYDNFITDYSAENNIQFDTYEYAKVTDCFSDMELGRLDAVICDSMVAEEYLLSHKDIFEITWIKDTEPEEFGICVKKGNTDLLNELNTVLKAFKDSGRLEEILADNY